MRKMFIHAGPPKTGTTLLQSQLLANSEALRAAKIVYIPNQGVVKRQRLRFRDYPGIGFDKMQSEFGDNLDIELQKLKVGDNESVILSWEEILGPGLFPPKLHVFPYAPVVMSQINGALAERGFEPHFLFHVRRQDEFLESWALQRVQAGNFLPFDEFVTNFVDVRKISWLRILEASEQVFGRERTHALLFDDLSAGPQFYLERFMSVVDPTVKLEYDDTLFSRLSFSAMAYEIALEAFKDIRKRDDRRRFTRFLQARCDSRTYGRCIFLTNEERTEIVEFYQEENQRLFQRFGLEQKVFDSHYTSASLTAGRAMKPTVSRAPSKVTTAHPPENDENWEPYFSL